MGYHMQGRFAEARYDTSDHNMRKKESSARSILHLRCTLCLSAIDGSFRHRCHPDNGARLECALPKPQPRYPTHLRVKAIKQPELYTASVGTAFGTLVRRALVSTGVKLLDCTCDCMPPSSLPKPAHQATRPAARHQL